MDWKFGVTTLVGVLALAVSFVPVMDRPSRGAAFIALAQGPLTPSEMKGVPLTISMDGEVLQDPYLTVFDFKNTGNSPILASEFDGPIQLRALHDVRIIRASITAAHPAALEPNVAHSEKAVSIQPLLLNGGDSFTVTMITSGGEAHLDPRVRIAGIASVQFDEDQLEHRKPRNKSVWLRSLVTLILATLYAAHLRSAFFGFREDIVGRFFDFFAGVTCALGAGYIANSLYRELDPAGSAAKWVILLGVAIIVVSAYVLAVLLYKLRREIPEWLGRSNPSRKATDNCDSERRP
jgi:hypothetical protein